MPKYIVEYTVPYVHRVQVGIEADSAPLAEKEVKAAFECLTIWDNTPEMPLLYDDFEESEGDYGEVEFKVQGGKVKSWPEPDGSVKRIELERAAIGFTQQVAALGTSGAFDSMSNDDIIETALDLVRQARSILEEST